MCRWLGVRFNDAKPKLCDVASAVLLAYVFVLCGGCSSLIFAFSIEKNKLIKSKKQCAASAMATKTMTEKQPCGESPFLFFF
jgi:hypothetical protein